MGEDKEKTISLKVNGERQTLDVNRSGSQQPLKYGKVYNYRKLKELPYHLLNAGRENELISEYMLNIVWLDAKIKAFSVEDVLEDFQIILDKIENKELSMIESAIRLARPSLDCQDEPTSQHLACELLGRMMLLKDKYPQFIGKLIKDCELLVGNYTQSLIVPHRQWLPCPAGPYLATAVGHTKPIRHMSVSPNGLHLVTCSEDKTARVWSLRGCEQLHILTHKGRAICNTY